MPPNQSSDPTPDDISVVMRGLPRQVRAYIEEERYTAVVQQLVSAYSLRVDQGGVLERELLLFLMGIEEAPEFATSLVQDGQLSTEVAQAIINDLNRLVFIPLQDQLRKPQAPAPKPSIPRPPIQQKPASQTTAPALAGTPLKPAASGASMLASSRPAMQPAPRANIPPMPPKPAAPQAQAPQSSPLAGALRTAGVNLLEDREEPHMDIKRPAAPPPAPAPAPAPMPVMNVMRPTAPPRPQMPSMPMPQSMPAPAVAPKPVAPTPPMPPAAPAKPYAVDPYREQPDDHEK